MNKYQEALDYIKMFLPKEHIIIPDEGETIHKDFSEEINILQELIDSHLKLEELTGDIWGAQIDDNRISIDKRCPFLKDKFTVIADSVNKGVNPSKTEHIDGLIISD